VTTKEDCRVKELGHEMVTCGLCSRRRKVPHGGFLAFSAGSFEMAMLIKALRSVLTLNLPFIQYANELLIISYIEYI